jgi:hypothetical protein
MEWRASQSIPPRHDHAPYPPLYPKPTQDVRRHLGLARVKTPFELHAADVHRAPHGGEVGVTAFRSLSGRGTVFGDKICKMVPCGPEGEQDHAGVLAPVGILLSPAVGAVLMSFSTIIVALNAQVLRGLDLRPSQT